MTIQLATYTWRGRTYKTLTGLCRATTKAYPGSAVSFDRNALYLSTRDRAWALRFPRTFTADHNSIVADQPENQE